MSQLIAPNESSEIDMKLLETEFNYQDYEMKVVNDLSSSKYRVLRGARCGGRGGYDPGVRYNIIGFRCVRT